MCLWASPAEFRAEHVYLPAWLGRTAVISNRPTSKKRPQKLFSLLMLFNHKPNTTFSIVKRLKRVTERHRQKDDLEVIECSNLRSPTIRSKNKLLVDYNLFMFSETEEFLTNWHLTLTMKMHVCLNLNIMKPNDFSDQIVIINYYFCKNPIYSKAVGGRMLCALPSCPHVPQNYLHLWEN